MIDLSNTNNIINLFCNEYDTYKVARDLSYELMVKHHSNRLEACKEYYSIINYDAFDIIYSSIEDRTYKIIAESINQFGIDNVIAAIENTKVFDLFAKYFENYYSSIWDASLDTAIKIVKKLDEAGLYNAIKLIKLNDDIYDLLILEDLSDDALIYLLRGCPDQTFETFINYSDKAIRLLPNIFLRPIKYPDHIIESEEFKRKFNCSIAKTFRYFVNNVLSKNASTRIYQISKEQEYNKIYELVDLIGGPNDPEEYREFNFANITEYIIDFLFEDYMSNVLINIYELLSYNSKYHLIDEHVEFYEQVANFNSLDLIKQIKFLEEYRDSDIPNQFYNDIRMCKDHMYNHMNEIILDGNDITKLSNQETTKMFSVPVINFMDATEPQYFLVRCSGNYDEKIFNPRTSRCCYSLISTENTNVFNATTRFIYGYYDMPIDHILHTFEEDSFSSISYDDTYSAGSNYINRICDPENLVIESSNYSEVEILNDKVFDEKSTRPDNKIKYLPRRPNYILHIDGVTDMANCLKEARRLNIPLVLTKHRQFENQRFSSNGAFGKERESSRYK